MKAILLWLSAITFINFALVENHTLTGTVVDENGEGLIGANILLKGTSRGTVTDFDGTFSLNVPTNCADLVVSYTGFTTQEVKACAGAPAAITLKAAAALDEVVVVGYGSRRDRRQARRKMLASAPAPTSYAAPLNAHLPQMNRHSGRSPHPPQDPEANRESYADIQENPFRQAVLAPQSTFSIDVDVASYSNIRRFLNNKELPPADAVRVEEMINYFNYNYPNPAGDAPFAVKTELTQCPWQPEHYLLQIGMQGKRIPTADLPASNLVFLLDVSGSMGRANKLPLLKQSLNMLTDNLRPEDKVAIVVYAGAAGLVLEPTSGTDQNKIKEALNRLQAGGSTAGAAGIQLAYHTARANFIEGGNNRVILATDGDFNVGVSSNEGLEELIEKERESGIFLSVLGFGMGNYQDDKMQLLADKGNGNHAYIDDLSEARKVLVTEFGGTLFTIAKDVKLQIDFNPEHVQGYRLIGYENRMLNNEDFADDTKDAGELGAGHTVTALYEIIPTGIEPIHALAPDTIAAVDLSEVSAEHLGLIKLRYKQPDGQTSQLLSQAISKRVDAFGQCSLNMRWAAAVTEFGLLLRNSTYKGQANYTHCETIARQAIGRDPFGYRQQMIDMIGQAKELAGTVVERN